MRTFIGSLILFLSVTLAQSAQVFPASTNGNNVFTGHNTFTQPVNGNGSGLTNLNLMTTNPAGGLVLTGSITTPFLVSSNLVSAGHTLIYLGDRVLADDDNTAALSWHERVCYDENGNDSIDWYYKNGTGYVLNEPSGGAILSWASHSLGASWACLGYFLATNSQGGYVGNAAGLTNANASTLFSTGTVPMAYLPASLTNQFVSAPTPTNATGNYVFAHGLGAPPSYIRAVLMRTAAGSDSGTGWTNSDMMDVSGAVNATDATPGFVITANTNTIYIGSGFLAGGESAMVFRTKSAMGTAAVDSFGDWRLIVYAKP